MTIPSPVVLEHSANDAKDRFSFGENWKKYLALVNDQRILRAEESLVEMLDITPIAGKTFLDIGSGSGLFSLAARRLGARVHSFDYDPQSVQCALALRQQYFPDDPNWRIERGSVLDNTYMRSLGSFDIVYSWGVLHHTGALWNAIAQAASAVAPHGKLFIAIYNDQGWVSRIWKIVKRTYNRMPEPLRFLIVWPCFVLLWGPPFVRDLMHGHPLESWKRRSSTRGMSPWRDLIDWVGGYPFEVAKPKEITDFLASKSFALRHIKTCGQKMGCNEFVFERL